MDRRSGTKSVCIIILILMVLYFYLTKVPNTENNISNSSDSGTPLRKSSQTSEVPRSKDKLKSVSPDEWCKTHLVAQNGAFCHQNAYVGMDTVMAPKIVSVIKDSGGKTVGDFGAGPGLYSKFFNESGLISRAYDGSRITPDYVTKFDISKPLLSLPVFDWVVCLEVGEHVPMEFQYIVLDNIANHASMGTVLSWSVIGQAGTAHVNNRNNDWVIEQMLVRNFVYNKTASMDLRKNPTFRWFKGTAMVFHKRIGTQDKTKSADQEEWCKTHIVAKNGAFCKKNSYVGLDTAMAPKIVSVIKDSGGKTVGDFGAGPGLYSKFFNTSGLVSMAYDGSHSTPDYVTKFDISKPLLSLPVFDWVVCLEVGEHVPMEFQYIVLDNIANHASMGAVLSWSVIGQGGTAHVNNRNNDWVIEQMLERKFAYNETASMDLRKNPTFWWFAGTAMVFHRNGSKNKV